MANFSLSDIEMESFVLDESFGPMVWILWLSILWFGFKFWGFGFHLWVLVVFNSGFGSLVFWLFFRVSLDPVERCILVSGTRIGRRLEIPEKCEKM